MEEGYLLSASELRHNERDLRATWRDVFADPMVSEQNMRSKATSGFGLDPGSSQAAGPSPVLLRSLYWRVYHGLLPDPAAFQLYPDHCSAQRMSYDALRRQYLIAPDGRWAADCSSDASFKQPVTEMSSSSKGKEKAWDPLNLEGENPWKVWFAALDLRATIRQDVERTFPDMPYFTIPSVRTSLTTILFLYSVLNPEVGYRQGMHELLASILMIIDLDSLPPLPTTSSFLDPISRQAPELVSERAMHATLSRDHVEHDAFTLFSSLMKAGKSWYEWRAEEGPRIPGQPVTQAPVIALCNHMQGELLRRIDPQLWERLETEGVEAQIWGIRWIRLIFTRELPFKEAMQMWDGVFADDPDLNLIEFICIAMLLRIRNELLNADYPTILTNLLRYPGASSEYPLSPTLLLSQAIMLRGNISPTAGVQAVLQNHEVLGIKPAPDEDQREPSPPRRTPAGRGRSRGGLSGTAGRAPPGVQGLAQGLFERAQAAGLDKAFMSTVADLRKNLPDLSSPTATAYSYIPSLASSFSPLGSPALQADVSSPFSSIPSSASPLPSHRFATAQSQAQSPAQSHTPVRSLRDAEKDLAELRLAMLGMGKAMSGWLLSLEAGGEEAEAAKEGMGKLKETLLNAATVETSTIVHQWGWSEALETPPSRLSTPVKVHPGSRTMSPAPQATPPSFSTFERSAGPNGLRESPAQSISPQAAPSQPVQLGNKPGQTGGVASARNSKNEPRLITQTPPIESLSTTPVDPLSGGGVGSDVGIHRTGSGRTRPPKQAARRGFAPQSSASVDPLLGLDI